MNQDINQIIKDRRSHYPQEFTGMVLKDDIIDVLLENANWAPNHTLNYPWRFKILKGDTLTAWLQKAIDMYQRDTPTEKFSQKKLDKLEMYKSKVSHVIVIVKQADGEKPGHPTEDICAVACSVQNIYLSLSQFPEAAGYWSTGLGTYKAEMHQFLNLSTSQQLMGYFMLGHVEQKRTESRRRSVEEFMI
jgi:nitroreductase